MLARMASTSHYSHIYLDNMVQKPRLTSSLAASHVSRFLDAVFLPVQREALTRTAWLLINRILRGTTNLDFDNFARSNGQYHTAFINGLRALQQQPGMGWCKRIADAVITQETVPGTWEDLAAMPPPAPTPVVLGDFDLGDL